MRADNSPVHRAPEPRESLPDPPSLRRPAIAPSAPPSFHRNLFAFVAAPRVTRSSPPLAAPAIASLPAALTTSAARPPDPAFAYRFIGTFGDDRNPIAAFARDGEVVIARSGERVGDFVLRQIGIESVRVERTAEAIQQIPLGAAPP